MSCPVPAHPANSCRPPAAAECAVRECDGIAIARVGLTLSGRMVAVPLCDLHRLSIAADAEAQS